MPLASTHSLPASHVPLQSNHRSIDHFCGGLQTLVAFERVMSDPSNPAEALSGRQEMQAEAGDYVGTAVRSQGSISVQPDDGSVAAPSTSGRYTSVRTANLERAKWSMAK